MKGNHKLVMNLGGNQGNPEKPQQKGNGKTSNEGNLPPPVVKTIISSSQSLTASIGIGEFGMNPAHKGSAVAFSMGVKDHHLFPKLKFLKGTDASLGFSMDATSICGFLQINCGVSKADAFQWWDDHHVMLKSIHTDYCNNKIKMIKTTVQW
jgi:hypothetical protein